MINMPRMLIGEELHRAMRIMPLYNEEIRQADPASRLTALSDLYSLYMPSQMSSEIYSKLYLAVLRSLQKKETREAVQQRNRNHCMIHGGRCDGGIIGGADSFTIIGESGIGKSTAIRRSLDLIDTGNLCMTGKNEAPIIPCMVVQCPFDASVKGLMLEILRKADEALGTTYYQNAARSRVTTDMLIGTVSQMALNHIGLLIVDEIQNVVRNKSGRSLVGMLTQLINNSGISIGMVGTPDSRPFFEQAMQLARRSLGLYYERLSNDQYFREFCHMAFRHQYVRNRTKMNPAIEEWLFEHSGGVISVVISLLHDAQEIAILSGYEALDLTTLSEAYKQRLMLLHDYVRVEVKKPAKRSAAETTNKSDLSIDVEPRVGGLVEMAKEQGLDVVNLLKNHLSVTEVVV